MNNINKTSEISPNIKPTQVKKTMIHNTVRLVALSAFLGLASINATAGSRLGVYTFDHGGDWAGISGLCMITANNFSFYGNNTADASLIANSKVKFLKQTIPVFDFYASASSYNGSPMANYDLKVVGWHVDSGTPRQTYQWSKQASKTLVSVSYTYNGFILPITLTGSVGGNADIDCTLRVDSSGASISGHADVWATVAGSGRVGVSWANGGVIANCDLGRTSLRPSISVTPTTMYGGVDLVFNAVSIGLDAYAHLEIDLPWYLGGFHKSWNESKNLYTWSSAPKTLSLIRL